MARRVKYGAPLKRHVDRYNLHEKIRSIISLLGPDAQEVFDWAQEEAKRQKAESMDTGLGKNIFKLVGQEAAIRLVRQNHKKGRLTTKNEVRLRTGLKAEMPVLYREVGIRHPQEARNLRHNIFHESFLALIMNIFPDVTTSVPSTGEGLTPDLMVHHEDPKWTISVEYKGYRSVTLLSESEVLKGMRYQAAFGSAWLVTTTTKSVRELYGRTLKSEEVIERGITRLRKIAKRSAYTEEQRENRGIAKKGIRHLEKHTDDGLRCKLLSAKELLDSCKIGKPLKGLAISTGFEFVDMLTEAGFQKEAEDVLRIMKLPTHSIRSDTVTSIRLIG